MTTKRERSGARHDRRNAWLSGSTRSRIAAAIAVLLLLSTQASAWDPTTTNFNRDALTDIAFHNPSSTWSSIPIMFATGDGRWTGANGYAPSWANQPDTIAVPGHFNHDGVYDIAFYRPGSTWSTAPVLFGNGYGGWSSTNDAAPSWAHAPGATAIRGDYNGDGAHRPGLLQPEQHLEHRAGAVQQWLRRLDQQQRIRPGLGEREGRRRRAR